MDDMSNAEYSRHGLFDWSTAYSCYSCYSCSAYEVFQLLCWVHAGIPQWDPQFTCAICDRCALSFPSTWTIDAYRFGPAMMTDPVPANHQIPSNQPITNNHIRKSANHCIVDKGRPANRQRISTVSTRRPPFALALHHDVDPHKRSPKPKLLAAFMEHTGFRCARRIPPCIRDISTAA